MYVTVETFRRAKCGGLDVSCGTTCWQRPVAAIDAVTGRGGEAHGRRRGASAGPPRANARRARSGSGRGRRGASAGGRRGRDGERRPRAGQRGGGGPELHPAAQQGDEGEAAEAKARGCQGGARRPHCPVHRIAPRDLLRQRAVVPCDRHGAGGGRGRGTDGSCTRSSTTATRIGGGGTCWTTSGGAPSQSRPARAQA